VIIPMYNCETTIRATLDSLISSNLPPDEVICVDDASGDDTVLVVKRFTDCSPIPVKMVELSPGCGPAGARNRGAKESGYSHLLFVDSDVVLRADTIATLMKRSESLEFRGAVISLYDEHNLAGGVLSDFTTLYSAFNYSFDSAWGSSHFSSQCALVSRDDFFRVGAFDETYPRATVEDIEFGLRLHAATIPVVSEPEARVSHNSSYDFRRFVMNYWNKCFDFSYLFFSKRNMFRDRQGYGGRHAQISILLISILILSVFGTMIWSCAWWSFSGACGLLVFHWRRFMSYTERRLGIRRVIPFLGLKILILGICAIASIVAPISRMSR